MHTLLSEGSQEELQQTTNTQLAITLANRSASIVLDEMQIFIPLVAGFSLGELSALATSKIIDDQSLITIVIERARLMKQVIRSSSSLYGELGMVAAIGLSYPEVEAVVTSSRLDHIYCSNDNSPTQVVIAGAKQELDEASDLLKAAGVRNIIPLKVSGPFHTPLLNSAVEPFSSFLETIPFNDPNITVISSVSGEQISSGSQARLLLARQLANPVRWTQAMKTIETFMQKTETNGLLEVGPGMVLTKLWRSYSDAIPVFSAGSMQKIESIMAIKEMNEDE